MAKYSRTNLIINYLPQDFSDDEFRSLFGNVAPVKRAKVCRDKRTGYSFGFGFCEFYSAEDAGRAIQALNGLQLQRKTLKVAYARLQSAESKNCNLHLTNLPAGVTAADIHAVLSPHGGIINCKILCDGQGASRGIGFCLFETRSGASDALHALHGNPWPGRPGEPPIQIRFADENEKKVRPPALPGGAVLPAQQPLAQPTAPPLPPPQPPPPPPPPPPPYEFYASAPPTSGGVAAQFVGSGAPYGYPAAAAMPYQFYPPPQPHQQPPQLQLPLPLAPVPLEPPVVCVCNLPPGTDESQLCAMFAPFGGLADVLLEPPAGHQPAPAEGDHQAPGPTALVAFTNYQSAAGAALHWNGQTLCGRIVQAWLRRGGRC